MRESFGFAPPAFVRPTGGKGTLKLVFADTPITGFWIEYPGSKDTAWLAPAETAGQTWKFCGVTNPNEVAMPSPLQDAQGNGGCLISSWRDVITAHPTALMPFKVPTSSYQVSIDTQAAPLGTYLGVGFTDSSVLDSNLETSGTLWVRLSETPGIPLGPATTVDYELRTNGMSGPVLASGTTAFNPFMPVVFSYDPAAALATVTVNGILLGTFPVKLSPHFIGIEGVGIVDNLVVRQLP